MPPQNPLILAHHLIITGYGFWLPNDPRGSGSSTLREPKFADLGPIHPGRKSHQPPHHELRAFYTAAAPRLEHQPLWLNQTHRECLASDLEKILAYHRYTAYACSIGANHLHLCLRRHRDTYQKMFQNIIDPTHPLWADRPYSVFCHTVADIRRTIRYIESNPAKEGLLPQHWTFVKPYDGWPDAPKKPPAATR